MIYALLATATFQSGVLGADLALLTQGVKSVPKIGVPGPVCAIRKDALPFVLADDEGVRPLAVAARWGRGKVIAIGHGGYLGAGNSKQADLARLMTNMIRWTSKRGTGIKVGTFRGEANGIGKALGFEEITVTPQTMMQADVIVMETPVDAAAIRDYVQKGGGLIVGATPWGWKQVHRADNLLGAFGWNRILNDAGILFADGYLDSPRVPGNLEDSQKANAAYALEKISTEGNAVGLISAAVRDCPDEDPFAKSVRQSITGTSIKSPTRTAPLTEKDGLSRLALVIQDLDRREGKPMPKIDPSANVFPGVVATGATREKLSVQIPLDDDQWASTGTYAAAGDTIKVTLPEALVGKGLGLQIGVHSDTLWHLKKWERHPRVVVSTAIKGNQATLSSPFGGLVVITVPRNLGIDPQTIQLENVVASPRYVLGKTTAVDWKKSLSSAAPWAELQSKHLILSVPTEAARKVEDPSKLMALWDRVMGLFTELDGSPLTVRPERIVADQQISAGYMHSGYPIMTWLDDSVPLSLDVDRLTKDGTWGHWHELGHNRQQGNWTFDGTGEVTNNVYVLYAMQKINAKSVFSRVNDNKKQTETYLANPKFDTWKSEPFVALTMYAQLVDAFGWDAYQKVMRSYLSDPRSALPKNDDEKRDQWMIRYSRQVGKNLAPFFKRWGVPVSAQAEAQIASLPQWRGSEVSN